jgi:hypothetical protein
MSVDIENNKKAHIIGNRMGFTKGKKGAYKKFKDNKSNCISRPSFIQPTINDPNIS